MKHIKITIEGLAGTGKSSIAATLAKLLKTAGNEVILKDENQIRDIESLFSCANIAFASECSMQNTSVEIITKEG